MVVANRLPLDDSAAPDGACEWRRSPGGLASALHAILQQTPATWVGWAGGIGAAPALPDIDGVRMRAVAAGAEDDCAATTRASPTRRCGRSTTTPSSSRSSTAAGGRRTSGSTGGSPRPPPRWPSRAPWSGCRTTTCNWCPAMLRELRPDLLIGFFLHVPFPPPELFMQLPRRAELLRGMLGADLVGFQRPQAAHNFAQLATKLLGAAGHRRPDRASTGGRCGPARSRSPSTSPRCRRWPPGRTWSATAAQLRADLGEPAAGAAQRRPAGLHQGHRAPAQGVQRAAARRAGQGPRHGDGAGGGAEPGAGRAATRSCATGSSARSAGSTASTAGSASRRSTT